MASTHMASGSEALDERSGPMSALLARNWWAVALRGALAVLFGVAALLLPGVTLASLVFVFAAYLLIDGGLAIASAVRAARRHERWTLFAFEGAADIAAGLAAFLVPAAALLVFVWLVAGWAILSGLLMLGAMFRLRRDHGRGWLALGGVASVLFGALLAVFPITGLVVLTWWLGAYALVFGASLLALALVLRRRHTGGRAGRPGRRRMSRVAPGRRRTALAGLAAASAIFAVAPALAAPTCWDKAGHTVKCGTPSALPVGQALSPEQELARLDETAEPEPRTLAGLACVLGGLFLLIGLMPDFDGWSPNDGRGRPSGED